MSNTEMTGAKILLESLLKEGVDTVFGYPGGAVLNIYDEIYKYSDRITHILTAHEQGAAHAADGYARASGKVGVVIATSGPGATNLVTGIAAAYMDSIPMVAITGNVAVDLLGRDSFQEVDITGITAPITKHNYIVKDVKELAGIVSEAFKIANTGRKGPVLIDIPKDITAAKCVYPANESNEFMNSDKLQVPVADEADLAAAAQWINSAERPVIYLGGGIISSGASAKLMELCEKSDIPVASTMMALGAVPAGHPLNLGLVGMHGNVMSNRAVHECDLLIAMGARFSDRVAGDRKKFVKNARIIHIDVDNAEFNKNVKTQLQLHGDLFDVLSGLIDVCEDKSHAKWRGKIGMYMEDYLRKFGNLKPADQDMRLETLAKPRHVIETVANILPDAVVVTDVGQHQLWVAQCFPFLRPRSLLTSGGLGAMGYGLGAAIGAYYAGTGNRVVLFSGDGSFHMNLNEITTLASYNIPVIVIVMNNSVLGMVRQWQKAFYGGRFSHTDPHRKTDIVKLAEAFGATGMRIENESDVEIVLLKAAAQEGPVIVDCRISPDANVLPMIPPGGGLLDMMHDINY